MIVQNTIRDFGMLIDQAVYGVVSWLMQLIMDLSNVEIFADSVIDEFASRIYIILGLIMVFKLMISFIQMLVNPDRMSDKEQGVGNILKRVVISLALIFLVPSIFDLARQVQGQILPVIPKVVLGVNVDIDTDTSETWSSVGRTMAFYSFSPFFTYQNAACNDGSIMGTGDDNQAEIWDVPSAADLVTEKDPCSTNKHGFKYSYSWPLSTLVGAYLVYVLVSIAVAVAIRAIKLSICELVAPIPIASYIDPKASKQTFDKWVSTTLKTYTDLFIRLIIVYFVVFVLQTLFDSDTGIIEQILKNVGNDNLRKSLVVLFIIVGLLQFVKQAPKFIGDMLGLQGAGDFMGMFKGDGFKAFKEAAGIPGTAAGALSSGIKNFRNSYQNSWAKDDPNAKWWKKAASGLNATRRAVGGFAGATRRGLAATYKGEGWQGAYTDNVAKTVKISQDKVLEKKADRKKNREARGRISDSKTNIATSEQNITNYQNEADRLMTEMNANGDYQGDLRNARNEVANKDSLRNAAQTRLNNAQARLNKANSALESYKSIYETADANYRTLASYDVAQKNVAGAEMAYNRAKANLDAGMRNGVSGSRLEQLRNDFINADVALKNAKNKLNQIQTDNANFDFNQDLQKVSSDRFAAEKQYKTMVSALDIVNLQNQVSTAESDYNLANQAFMTAESEVGRLEQLKVDYDDNIRKISEERGKISTEEVNIATSRKEIVRPIITDIKTNLSEFVGDSIPTGKDYIDLASHLRERKKSVYQGEAFTKIERNISLISQLGQNGDGVFTYGTKDKKSQLTASFQEMVQARDQFNAGAKVVTINGVDVSSDQFREFFEDAQKTVGAAYVNAVIEGRKDFDNSAIKTAQTLEIQKIMSMNIPNSIKEKYVSEITNDFGNYLKRAGDEADKYEVQGNTLLSWEKAKKDNGH